MLKFVNKTKNCIFLNKNLISLKRFITSDRLNVNENVDNGFEKDVQTRKQFKLLPQAKYGGQNFISLIYDEYSEEYAKNIKDLFRFVHAPVIFNDVAACDTNEVLMSILRNRTALMVNISTGEEKKSESFFFNNELDLFGCIVNIYSTSFVEQKFKDINITIIMQNNTGDYSKLEYEPVKGIVETLKMCHDNNIRRILHSAFKYAKQNKRKKITVAHKSDEIPKTEKRFVEIAKALQSKHYPEIQLETILANTLARKIVMCPLDFDVICCNEKYGTCLMSIISGLCGHPSVFCATEIGSNHAVFKPLVGKMSLNEPRLSVFGSIMCGIQLLRYMDQPTCAENIVKALRKTIEEDKIITEEFGGKYSNTDVICKVVENLKNYVCQH